MCSSEQIKSIYWGEEGGGEDPEKEGNFFCVYFLAT